MFGKLIANSRCKNGPKAIAEAFCVSPPVHHWLQLTLIIQVMSLVNINLMKINMYFMVEFIKVLFPWCRHQMETFSALLSLCAGYSPVTGEFPAQKPVTRSFHVFFDLRLNKRLSKQWRRRWFETLSHLLWRQNNAYRMHLKKDHGWKAFHTTALSLTHPWR